jgi:assimilatory nitrate reductase catalytic subunit
MGSRLFSNTTNLLGGRSFTDAAQRAEVAKILDTPVESIPDRPSLAYDQIVDGVRRGEIRGLWIIATNPAHSWVDETELHDLLARLDFLVVQDMYATSETARHAHLFLPAAGWGEKDGTFINSERRIGAVKKVARAPGQALADFRIFQLIAEYWGCGERFRRWSSPEAVFRILAELSAGQPCDFSAVRDYAALEGSGPQWPCTGPVDEMERRLFADGRFYHPDRRARFVFAEPEPLPEAPCDDYPFLLLSGRGSSSQWHTQTRTGKSAVLRHLYPADLYVEINPADAGRLRIAANDWVIVASRRGEARARAFVTQSIAPGQLFIPMHYPDANRLTIQVFDPHSRQPAYKACSAAVRAAPR